MSSFTHNQVRELEDVIINHISPVYAKLQMVRDNYLTDKDRNIMMRRVEDVVDYIRSLYHVPTLRRR